MERVGEHTIESSLMPLALPQALMTQASLKAMQATISTPLAFSLERFSMKPGRCLAEQPGVKAVHCVSLIDGAPIQ